MPLLAGSCVLLGVAPTMFLVNVRLGQILGLALFMSFIAGMFSAVASPVIKSVLLNVNEPEVRGVAGALQTITDDLGKALGPFIVAGFIQILGRQNAFNIAVCGWFLCGFMILSLVFCMRRDEEKMQERLMMSATTEAPELVAQNAMEEGALEEGGGASRREEESQSPDGTSSPLHDQSTWDRPNASAAALPPGVVEEKT